jgi:hypothetical protein
MQVNLVNAVSKVAGRPLGWASFTVPNGPRALRRH